MIGNWQQDAPLEGEGRGDVKRSFCGGNYVFCQSPFFLLLRTAEFYVPETPCADHRWRWRCKLSVVSFSLPGSGKFLNRGKWWFSPACCRCFWIKRYFHYTEERAQFSVHCVVPAMYGYSALGVFLAIQEKYPQALLKQYSKEFFV